MTDRSPLPARKNDAPSRPVSRTPRGPGALPPQEEQEEHLELPHEREQSTHATSRTPDPAMVQAHKDLKEGQVDTDMRATPGLGAERREGYVPGAGGKPPAENAKGSRRK